MEIAKYIVMFLFLVLLVGIWLVGTAFADTVSKHEVITPEHGVKCIVVSRMFNTSVDCWKEL